MVIYKPDNGIKFIDKVLLQEYSFNIQSISSNKSLINPFFIFEEIQVNDNQNNELIYIPKLKIGVNLIESLVKEYLSLSILEIDSFKSSENSSQSMFKPFLIKGNKLKIYNNKIDISAEIEIIADSVALPEGPVWDEKSNSLYFSDVISNKIFRWNEVNGTSEFIVPSGNTGYAPNLGEGILGANGLALDIDGNLILCQHGDRRIAMLKNMESDVPKFETIVDNFEGKTLNRILKRNTEC